MKLLTNLFKREAKEEDKELDRLITLVDKLIKDNIKLTIHVGQLSDELEGLRNDHKQIVTIIVRSSDHEAMLARVKLMLMTGKVLSTPPNKP